MISSRSPEARSPSSVFEFLQKKKCRFALRDAEEMKRLRPDASEREVLSTLYRIDKTDNLEISLFFRLKLKGKNRYRRVFRKKRKLFPVSEVLAFEDYPDLLGFREKLPKILASMETCISLMRERRKIERRIEALEKELRIRRKIRDDLEERLRHIAGEDVVSLIEEEKNVSRFINNARKLLVEVFS